MTQPRADAVSGDNSSTDDFMNNPANSDKLLPGERKAAFSLAALYVLRMLGLFLILPVFALYAEHLAGTTPLLVGLAIGSYGLTQACLQIPFGMLSDRLGRRDPDGQPLYGGACRALNASAAMARIEAGAVHAWRIDMGACRDEDAAIWGDAAIARLMNGSSYHIAVVTDDHLQGVTHVVRGRDIEAATPLHRLLQRLLGFRSPLYYHHALILDEQGRKLSKSDRSRSLADLRSAGIAAAEIRRRLGFA